MSRPVVALALTDKVAVGRPYSKRTTLVASSRLVVTLALTDKVCRRTLLIKRTALAALSRPVVAPALTDKVCRRPPLFKTHDPGGFKPAGRRSGADGQSRRQPPLNIRTTLAALSRPVVAPALADKVVVSRLSSRRTTLAALSRPVVAPALADKVAVSRPHSKRTTLVALSRPVVALALTDKVAVGRPQQICPLIAYFAGGVCLPAKQSDRTLSRDN